MTRARSSSSRFSRWVNCFLLRPALAFSFVDFVGIIGFRPFVRRDAGAQSWSGAPRYLLHAANRARRVLHPTLCGALMFRLRRVLETRESRRRWSQRR